MSDPRTRELSRIRSAARAVELRLRAGRALEALPPASTLGLGLVAIVLAARKVAPGHVSELRARELCAGAIAIAVAWVATAALRRLPPRAGTVALDRHHALHDRLSNALAFSALPDADRTPLMEVAIDDACEHAGKLAPSKAAPLRFPRELVASALVGLGVALVAMLEVRTPRREAPVQKVLDPLAMSPDDIELFRDAARELSAKDQSPEVKAAVERFNQLIEDIAQKRLDRTEAFRRMEAIERELLKGAEADKKSLEDALDETGKELARSDLAKPIGESLQKKDLEQAKKAMKDLAARLRDKKPVDKKELERLREALKRAAARKKEALTALNEKRAELKEQLLKKKSQPQDPDAGAPNPEEERLLKKKERELERLDREAEQRERAGRQLDRLDRELSKAAEDLMRDLGMSAQDLEQAAEDINRLQDEQMSEKEKEELRQRLEELRELLRQQGQGGKQRMARLLKFGKRARGKGQQGEGQKGDKGDQGEKGDKGDPEGDDEGEGQDGQSGQNGGKDGQGDKQLVIGPGGKRILISKGAGQSPGQGSGPPQPGGDGQGAGQGQQGTSEGGGEGRGIGSGHDGNVAGKRTDPKMGTADVQAQGLDTQQGPTNSEVILGAAERGFKGSGYKKVFTQYRTVAEQEMNKDTIPDGYRFYVHRYFQLIRPRE